MNERLDKKDRQQPEEFPLYSNENLFHFHSRFSIFPLRFFRLKCFLILFCIFNPFSMQIMNIESMQNDSVILLPVSDDDGYDGAAQKLLLII